MTFRYSEAPNTLTMMEGFRLGEPPITAAIPMTAMATMTRLPDFANTMPMLMRVKPTARV